MYCVLYKPFTTIVCWECDAGERDFGSVVFDVAQGHLCFHVLMFLLWIERRLAGLEGFVDIYDFPF